MKAGVKKELEKIAGLTLENKEDYLVAVYQEYPIFNLDNNTGNIIYAHVGNMKELKKEDEDNFMTIFKKFVGW